MAAFHDPEVCRNILESLPVGLCVVDLDKKIVFWSDGAERITGHPRHEVIGRSCVADKLLHCDHTECEICAHDFPMAVAIKTSQPAESIGYLHHKAGHQVPVRIFARPVRNEHGSIIGALETFEDQSSSTGSEDRKDSLNLPGCVDEITGVASHALMRSHLREALGTLTEIQVPFGLLCFQLEGLQHFQASYGPEAAASLLRLIARTLEVSLAKRDFVGRWSNDQFLVILNGCRADALHLVAERIRHMLAGEAIEWWGELHSLPVSIGEATARAEDSVTTIVARAQASIIASPARAVAAAAADVGKSSF